MISRETACILFRLLSASIQSGLKRRDMTKWALKCRVQKLCKIFPWYSGQCSRPGRYRLLMCISRWSLLRSGFRRESRTPRRAQYLGIRPLSHFTVSQFPRLAFKGSFYVSIIPCFANSVHCFHKVVVTVALSWHGTKRLVPCQTHLSDRSRTSYRTQKT